MNASILVWVLILYVGNLNGRPTIVVPAIASEAECNRLADAIAKDQKATLGERVKYTCISYSSAVK